MTLNEFVNQIAYEIDEYYISALDTISEELFKYIDCRNCPCSDSCKKNNTPIGCTSNLYLWLREITENKGEENNVLSN